MEPRQVVVGDDVDPDDGSDGSASASDISDDDVGIAGTALASPDWDGASVASLAGRRTGSTSPVAASNTIRSNSDAADTPALTPHRQMESLLAATTSALREAAFEAQEEAMFAAGVAAREAAAEHAAAELIVAQHAAAATATAQQEAADREAADRHRAQAEFDQWCA